MGHLGHLWDRYKTYFPRYTLGQIFSIGKFSEQWKLEGRKIGK